MFDQHPLGSPLVGEWLVLNPPGHGPFAFDLVGLDAATGRAMPRSRWALAAGRVTAHEFHGWSRPVVAPLSGEVTGVHDREPDTHRLRPLVDVPAGLLIRPYRYRNQITLVTGNHVVLSTRAGYVLVAHLQRDSIAVEPGQEMQGGERLGSVGNSGNSMAPHLHIQVMDGPDPGTARALPFRLARYEMFRAESFEEVLDAPLPTRATRIRFPEPTPTP